MPKILNSRLQRIWAEDKKRLEKISVNLSNIEGRFIQPPEIINRLLSSSQVEEMLKRGAEMRRRQGWMR